MKTFTLTDNEIKLLKEFLDQLHEHMGNSGCNDFNLENTDENWKMLQEIDDKEGVPEEDRWERPKLNKKLCSNDFGVLSYLENKMGLNK